MPRKLASKFLITLGDSAYLLAVWFSLGAIIEVFFRQTVSRPLTMAIVFWSICIVSFYLRRRFKLSATLQTRILGVSIAGALVFAGMFCLPDSALIYHFEYDEASDVWLWKPNSIISECNPNRGCFEHRMDECSFRGEPGREGVSPEKSITLVGDSFIFGSGVRDGHTLAEALESEFMHFQGGPYIVKNRGVPGTAISSFPRMLAQAQRCSPSELYVILIKSDDLDRVDISARLDRIHHSTVYKFLAFSGFEPAYEVWRLSSRDLNQDSISSEEFTRQLDRLDKEAGASRLLFLSTLQMPISDSLREWVRRHPRHGLNALGFGWEPFQPDIIPGDGHWNERGVLTVAKAIRTPIAWMIEHPEKQGWRDSLTLPYAQMEENARWSLAFSDDETTVNLTLHGPERDFPLKVFWCGEGKSHYMKIGETCFALDKMEKPLKESEEKWLQSSLGQLPVQTRSAIIGKP